ncbi:MAG: PqqD family protein [Bacillati bacterium ANGP1]|uniref:PqqD family protein n=1 Tax=Candidatus Segetimicrobium genomatis TaxID=2569760 RepID=A0A537K0H3_9BACT|nr:MAG: PqqD family protein [Terrabacteria group bacterium ANGP1]
MPPDAATTRPARRNGAEEHRLDDEVLLFVPSSEQAFTLNRSAVAIWELCDGIRTIEEITEELGQCIGRSRTALLTDVIQGVTRLYELGLLELR